MAATIWLELLAELRARQEGRDHRGKKGSLRWLEALVAEEGGRPGTVRNILYKDLGSPEEKARLFGLLRRLHQEVGLEPPATPDELKTAAAKRLLGRDKRLIFARFARGLGQGACPQLVVVGRPATGKSVLLEQLRAAHPEHSFLNLARDLAPVLHALAEGLGVAGYRQRLAQLSPAHAYALQAQHQRDIRDLFVAPINEAGKPFFIRAEQRATLGGLPLRDASGAECEVSVWLEPLLTRLTVPYVAACSSAPPTLPHTHLRPPSRQEARRYLRERLPEASVETLEGLLNRAGRNYGELSRLALLELFRMGEGAEADLHCDPRLGPLLRTLAALSPEADPEIPVALLERALGRSLSDLSQAERALLEPSGSQVRPALRSLLPGVVTTPEVHRLALEHFAPEGRPFRLVHHALLAGEHARLLESLNRDPALLAVSPGLWAEARAWPPALREELAVAVVRYRAVLGDYAHPEVREALALLEGSQDAARSAWARVKMAEAFIDEGNYEAAALKQGDLPPLTGEAAAEQLLVSAALKRWQGEYDAAEALVRQALALPIPPVLADRAMLWQGLVAKDAGRFAEALSSLRAVRHLPLLMGRARYQEGDILLREGFAEAAEARIRAGLGHLRDAAAEEQARVRARLATSLRSLGRYREAALHFRRAHHTAPDAFTRARVASEASLLEAARGRPWDALELASEAERIFRDARTRPQEARYRHRRTVYRLAVAYWVRDLGEPWTAPFRGSLGGVSQGTSEGMSPQAARLLEALLPDIAGLSSEADRYASLFLDATVLLGLMLEPRTAQRLLARFPDPPSAYLRQQLRLALAEVQLRLDDPREAAAQLVAVGELPPDPGLRAWKALLDAETGLLLGQRASSVRILDETPDLPEPFRRQLGRRWGQVLLARDEGALAGHWCAEPGPLALPEALAAAFVTRTRVLG